jgi:pSer/pThr/pTyr-binding forkhead associated (FHA) protein
MASTNGTFVNGNPVNYRILEPGDTITLGNTKIVLRR